MNDWQADAACRGKHELFFAPTHEHGGVQVGGAFDYAEALALCRQECLVVRECRAWALEVGELNHKGEAVHGVVAGVAPGTRPGKLASTALCGTPAGYKRHKRAGEAACRACRAANASYSQTSSKRRAS